MKYRLDIPIDLPASGHHILQLELEKMLLQEPEELVVSLGSKGPMDCHSALVYSRLLAARNASKTRLVTLAKGGLHDTELLLWLAGDERDLPADSWLYIRPPHPGESAQAGEFFGAAVALGTPAFPDPCSLCDHASVLEKLGEYLPVSELVGRPIRGRELEGLALCGASARALEALLSSLSVGPISGGHGRQK